MSHLVLLHYVMLEPLFLLKPHPALFTAVLVPAASLLLVLGDVVQHRLRPATNRSVFQ